MSFLRNRHDTWKMFCEQHHDVLAGTELPHCVTHVESRFRSLLEEGKVADSKAHISLADLNPRAWAELYRFAAVFFREFESYAPEDLFPGFRRETERRGDRFPR